MPPSPLARQGNDETFSKQLAALCDYYVNDAFGTVHRAHASTAGITKFVERKVKQACRAVLSLKKIARASVPSLPGM